MAIEKVYKANMPLKQDGKYWYPITRFDQIVMADGSRWEGTVNTLRRVNLIFPASGWQQEATGRYTQMMLVEDFTAETRCSFIDVDMSEVTEDTIDEIREAWGLIDKAETVEGGVLLTAFDGAPEIDFNVIIEVLL